MGGFNSRCSYAMHFLMWLPLLYDSKLAKSIPITLTIIFIVI